MTPYDLFLDFALASILILAGQYLRSKITIFQKFFMPASMIAGFLGLVLGPNILNILPFSTFFGSYAGILIILIFTIVGVNGFEMGKDSGKEELQRIGGFQLYRLIALFIQFAIPILATKFLFTKIWPQLNEGFGMLLASGFYGGHGTAAAVGDTFTKLGWSDANDLAITFATIGILTGVFVGLALINIATRKSQTSYIKDFKYIDGDLKTGLVSKENRKSIGEETISPVALDTLCFHLSIVLGIAGISYMINNWIAKNFLSGIPDFTIAYIVALIFFLLFRNKNIYNYIDTNITEKISGTSTDYLVFFGISSIKLDVVAKYAGPLAAMALLGIAIVIFIVYPLGKGFNKDNWFERSIFIFGYSTGVFAIGFVLLRIVDPDNLSKTIEDTALTPLTSFLEIIAWSTFPVLLVNGKSFYIGGIMILGILICLTIAKITKTWNFSKLES